MQSISMQIEFCQKNSSVQRSRRQATVIHSGQVSTQSAILNTHTHIYIYTVCTMHTGSLTFFVNKHIILKSPSIKHQNTSPVSSKSSKPALFISMFSNLQPACLWLARCLVSCQHYWHPWNSGRNMELLARKVYDVIRNIVLLVPRSLKFPTTCLIL